MLRNKRGKLTAKSLQEGFIETRGTGQDYACLFFVGFYMVLHIRKEGDEDHIINDATFQNLKEATKFYNGLELC